MSISLTTGYLLLCMCMILFRHWFFVFVPLLSWDTCVDALGMQMRVAACVIIVGLVRVLNLAVPIFYRNAVNKLAEVSDATHPRHGEKSEYTFMDVRFYHLSQATFLIHTSPPAERDTNTTWTRLFLLRSNAQAWIIQEGKWLEIQPLIKSLWESDCVSLQLQACGVYMQGSKCSLSGDWWFSMNITTGAPMFVLSRCKVLVFYQVTFLHNEFKGGKGTSN